MGCCCLCCAFCLPAKTTHLAAARSAPFLQLLVAARTPLTLPHSQICARPCACTCTLLPPCCRHRQQFSGAADGPAAGRAGPRAGAGSASMVLASRRGTTCLPQRPRGCTCNGGEQRASLHTAQMYEPAQPYSRHQRSTWAGPCCAAREHMHFKLKREPLPRPNAAGPLLCYANLWRVKCACSIQRGRFASLLRCWFVHTASR